VGVREFRFTSTSKAKLDDGTLVTLKIDRYLNAALKLPRNKDAEKAKDSLLNHIGGRAEGRLPRATDIHDRQRDVQPPQASAASSPVRDRPRISATSCGSPRHFQLTDAEKVAAVLHQEHRPGLQRLRREFLGHRSDHRAIREYDVNRRQAVADGSRRQRHDLSTSMVSPPPSTSPSSTK